MIYRDYEMKCLRTVDYEQDRNLSLANYCLGLAGEVSEIVEIISQYDFSESNIMELAKEIGDALWYLTVLSNRLGLIPESVSVLNEYYRECSNDINDVYALQISVGKILEIIKHYVMHKEVINFSTLIDYTWVTMKNLYLLADSYNIRLSDCAELNVLKLTHRYNLENGGRFRTVTQAQRRIQDYEFKNSVAYKEISNKIIKNAIKK